MEIFFLYLWKLNFILLNIFSLWKYILHHVKAYFGVTGCPLCFVDCDGSKHFVNGIMEKTIWMSLAQKSPTEYIMKYFHLYR